MSAASTRRVRIRWVLGGLVLVGLLATSLIVWALAPTVTAVAVIRGKAVDAVYGTATIEPAERVVVKAKTSGPIAEVFVKEGAVVKKGDLLARIDSPVLKYELQRGEAELQSARAHAAVGSPGLKSLIAEKSSLQADLEASRVDQGRLEQLTKKGAATQADLDRLRSKVLQLEGAIRANDAQQLAMKIDTRTNEARAMAQKDSMAARLSDAEVRAPMDGTVLSKAVELGEVVVTNQPMFRLGDVRDLILEANIDEADIGRIHDGTDGSPASQVAVSLYAFSGKVFRGRVFEILPDANRERRSFLTKIRLDERVPGLKSGMTGEVNIVISERDNVLLIPSDAETKGKVWVLEGTRVQEREVSLGIKDLLRAEVLGGLQEGDLVVIEGQQQVQPGARVRAKVRSAEVLKAPPPPTASPATI